MNPLSTAISPCPNDTFLFHGWIFGKVGKDIPITPVFADIQKLNEWAIQGRFPLIKVSFACYKNIVDAYEILPVGSALGFNSGPKLIAKECISLESLPSKKIAIPGQNTTAHLLLMRLFSQFQEKVFCLYHEIFDLLDSNVVDVGVIIHESRFTFLKKGFQEIADLGHLWQERFSLPLPLGCLAIKREIKKKEKEKIISALKASLAHARNNPRESQSFIYRHAKEKDAHVIDSHISLYVNNETENLTESGVQAIETLLDLDRKKWLFCCDEC